MPLYRYVCRSCGYEKVVMHSMNESPDVECDVCGARMERMISRVGVIFKGRGFYVTDSRKSDESSKKEKTTKKEKEEVEAS